MAVGLLLSAFAKSYSKEELYLQQKFKERLADLHATVGKDSFDTFRLHYGMSVESKLAKGVSSASARVIFVYFSVLTEILFLSQVPP